MESAHAPLISNETRDDNELEYDADDATDTASISSRLPDARPGIFVLLLTFAAGISGLLFGCTKTHTYRTTPKTLTDGLQMIRVLFLLRSCPLAMRSPAMTSTRQTNP